MNSTCLARVVSHRIVLINHKTNTTPTFMLIIFLYVIQRWVWAYRKDRLLVNVNTNNGTERQNLGFKSEYLVGRRNSSLSTMLSILIEEFLPESYDR